MSAVIFLFLIIFSFSITVDIYNILVLGDHPDKSSTHLTPHTHSYYNNIDCVPFAVLCISMNIL